MMVASGFGTRTSFDCVWTVYRPKRRVMYSPKKQKESPC